MKYITEYNGTTASGKEMATEKARKRERGKWEKYEEAKPMEWVKGAIGDIVFGMHKVWWI